MVEAPYVERVMLQNYKSIARCNVVLRPLTVLVGPNGSGKSNFLDALRFVADGLNKTLDQAIRDRGGINDVRRRSGGHPNHLGIAIDLVLPGDRRAHYAFEIAARKDGGFEVEREECLVFGSEVARYKVDHGEVAGDIASPPAPLPDRLYLVTASGFAQFRGVYDALSRMVFYNLNPEAVRAMQAPDPGELLARDGRNLASVIGRMEKETPETKRRLEEYLSRIVPGLESVTRQSLQSWETLEFRQQIQGAKNPWRFTAVSMSDGTLRALGVLTALLQRRNGTRVAAPTLVGIEEPEAALHPAAAAVLLDALREASRSVQVVVTTHSPDLLDSEDVDTDSILAVRAEGDVTEIGPVDDVGRQAVQEGLYTPGELLRADQMTPDAESRKAARDTKRSLELFQS